MRSRPDGPVNSLSRIARHWRRIRTLGEIPLGGGFALTVSLFESSSVRFAWIGITLAGRATRRGIAVLLDEVPAIDAFFGRAQLASNGEDPAGKAISGRGDAGT